MDASASRANLLLKCGFWARSDVANPPNESGPGAVYGIAVHAMLEASGTGLEQLLDTDPALAALSEEDVARARVDAWALYTWHQSHIGGEKYHEQKIAFDHVTRTARVLQSTVPRDYSECSPDELPGTADLIAVKPDAVCVLDYKTGHTPWEIYKEQLNTLGLAASKIYNRSRVVCIVLKVAEGECYPHHWVMEQHQLDEFEERLCTAIAGVPSAEPTPGAHCTGLYCPIAGTCPATLARISADTNVQVDERDISTDCAIRDDEHANRLYQVKLLLGKSRATVDSQLKKYVDKTGGFVLPNSKKYMKESGAYREVRVKGAP